MISLCLWTRGKEKREWGNWKWSEWEGMNGEERKAAKGEMSERALAKRG